MNIQTRADPLNVLPVAAVAMQISDKIMLAYKDPNLSQAEFEAIIREIYGDEPEDM